MRKLKLDLEDLTTESFDTSPEARAREEGTVFGQNHCTCDTQCTCPGCPTYYETCGDTCPASCAYTCRGSDTCGGGYDTCMGDSRDGICGTHYCV